MVREACEEMLTKYWFASSSQNPIQLLRLMDVETCTDTCELAIRVIIRKGGHCRLMFLFIS